MYVIDEYLGPLIGPYVCDDRPRFKTKTEAVKELRKYIKECKTEYKSRHRYGSLKIKGNPWRDNVRLTFGCNLYTTFTINTV